MIAVNIIRRIFLDRRVKLESDSLLELSEKTIRRPSVAQEQKFQARALPMLTQYIGVAKQLRDPFDHWKNLIPAHESIQPRRQIRFSREPPGHAQRKSDFIFSVRAASLRGQTHIINFGIRAPDAASSDRHLELARQVVEFGIPRQQLRRFQNQGRSIDNFIGVHSGHRASSYVARDIATSAGRVEADLPEAVKHLRQRFDRDPMQLDILANREIGNSVGVAASEIGDGAKLRRSHHPVRDSEAHHESLNGLALAILAARDASAVALRVNAPPAEVRPNPFRRNRAKTFAGEAANLLKPLPGIFGTLQPLHPLRLGFFHRLCRRICHRFFPGSFSGNKKPTARITGGGCMSAVLRNFS